MGESHRRQSDENGIVSIEEIRTIPDTPQDRSRKE